MWRLLVAIGACAFIALLMIAILLYSARQSELPPDPNEESFKARMRGE